MMGGVDVEVVIDKGVLEKPSGIEIKNDLIYVTDTATSTFHVFKKDGTEVRKLKTDLPEGSLAGFTFGSDGKIWFTDRKGGRVMRIDPK
jgi:sugar lactone lactonase YvrE